MAVLGAAALTAGVAWRASVSTSRNQQLTFQGQLTDLYLKAVDQLGSKELDVRIGGIYALERVALDSAREHPAVMEILTAFIRVHSHEQWPPPDTGSSEQGPLTRPDVQAAVTVVGRRDADRDTLPIDLTGADLTRANLTRARLAGATLTGARLAAARLADAVLTGARLDGAVLTDADLEGATLTGADLTRANLTRAYIAGANLTQANLTQANLTGADLATFTAPGSGLIGTRLTGALLTGARLAGARLDGADLTGADLEGAILTGATLSRTDLTGADLTGARWPEGAPVPDGWMADGDSGRLRRAGQLSEITAHYS